MVKKLNEIEQKIYDEMHKQIGEYTQRTTATIFNSTKAGNVSLNYNHACHAGMGDAASRNSPILGIAMAAGEANKKKKEYQDLASFMWENPLSPYAPHIKAMGDDFVVVRDKDGFISGIMFLSLEYSIHALMNLAKSARVFCEHDHVIQFWKKYTDKGVPPTGLLFVMSFFYATDGSRRRPGHGPVDDAVGVTLNFRRLLGKWNEDEFDFKTNPMTKTGAYHGENRYLWVGKDGKFNIRENIRKAGKKTTAPTRFYAKFYEKTPEQLSDDDILLFLKEAFEGGYDNYL